GRDPTPAHRAARRPDIRCLHIAHLDSRCRDSGCLAAAGCFAANCLAAVRLAVVWFAAARSAATRAAAGDRCPDRLAASPDLPTWRETAGVIPPAPHPAPRSGRADATGSVIPGSLEFLGCPG